MKSVIIATCLLAVTIPAPVGAHYDCHPTANSLGTITLGTGEPGSTTFYIDDMGVRDGGRLVIYQETNMVAGLQRGGGSSYIPEDYFVCPDTPDVTPDFFVHALL